jgi:hypothetical protein
MTERSGNVYENKGGWYVVGRERKTGAGDGADEGLPAAGAWQDHAVNLSCGSRKPAKLEKEFLFLTERTGNVYENKGSAFHERERRGNVYENKGAYP